MNKLFPTLMASLALLLAPAAEADQQKPVILKNGQLQQLQTGDSLDISFGANLPLATGVTGPLLPANGGGGASNAVIAGADNAGSLDASSIVQAALNAGTTDLYFPAGTYKLCGITVPNTFRLVIHGEGMATKIVQGNCGSPVFHWSTASTPNYGEQTIRDLFFDGTSGTGHTIDTSGAGGLTLRHLYFNNVPVEHDSIFVNGSGGSAEHDTRIIDAQFYSSAGGPAGNAMIELGPLAVDSLISHTMGNGAFVVGYGLKIAAGATTISVMASHLYNVTGNSLYALGCSNCQFSGNTWDNAYGDVAVVTASNSIFTGEQYESTNPGKNALTLANATSNVWTGTVWGTSSRSARYIVNETGASNYNTFTGGVLNSLTDWTNPYFSFVGPQSYAINIPGYSGNASAYGSVVYAKDNGVKCDGSTDDTGALNALLTSQSGKRIILPYGTCVYNGGGTLGDGTQLVGAGRQGTILSVNTAAPSQLLTVSGKGATLSKFTIRAAVTQTGGSWVLLSGWSSAIDELYFSGDYNGIHLMGSGSQIRNTRMEDGASGATRIFADGGDTSEIIDNVLIGSDDNTQRAGIEVKNNAALTISNTSVIQQGVNLLIDPDTEQTVASLYVHDSFFDNGKYQNISISTIGSGNVIRSRFANVWAGSSHSVDGVLISNPGSGIISGLHFADLHAVLNVGSGVTTAGSGSISDLVFDGGEFAGNSNGFYFNSGSNILVTNAVIGVAGGIAGNTQNGVVVSAGVTNYGLSNNIITGNASSQLADRGGAVSKVIVNNIGVNPMAGSISPNGSPYTWTNSTGAPTSVFVSGGTVSAVAIGGNTVSASLGVYPVQRGQSITVTYSAAPTMSFTAQ